MTFPARDDVEIPDTSVHRRCASILDGVMASVGPIHRREGVLLDLVDCADEDIDVFARNLTEEFGWSVTDDIRSALAAYSLSGLPPVLTPHAVRGDGKGPFDRAQIHGGAE